MATSKTFCLFLKVFQVKLYLCFLVLSGVRKKSIEYIPAEIQEEELKKQKKVRKIYVKLSPYISNIITLLMKVKFFEFSKNRILS